jgi:hypothetical protein
MLIVIPLITFLSAALLARLYGYVAFEREIGIGWALLGWWSFAFCLDGCRVLILVKVYLLPTRRRGGLFTKYV